MLVSYSYWGHHVAYFAALACLAGSTSAQARLLACLNPGRPWRNGVWIAALAVLSYAALTAWDLARPPTLWSAALSAGFALHAASAAAIHGWFVRRRARLSGGPDGRPPRRLARPAPALRRGTPRSAPGDRSTTASGAFETRYPASAAEREGVSASRECPKWPLGSWWSRNPGGFLLGGLLVLLAAFTVLVFLPWQHSQTDCYHHPEKYMHPFLPDWMAHMPFFLFLAIPYGAAWALGFAFRQSSLYRVGVRALAAAMAVCHITLACATVAYYARHTGSSCPFDLVGETHNRPFRWILFLAVVQAALLALLALTAAARRWLSSRGRPSRGAGLCDGFPR